MTGGKTKLKSKYPGWMFAAYLWPGCLHLMTAIALCQRMQVARVVEVAIAEWKTWKEVRSVAEMKSLSWVASVRGRRLG